MLFNDTIYYNIHYGRLSASREEVEEAAKQVGLHLTAICMLPFGRVSLLASACQRG